MIDYSITLIQCFKRGKSKNVRWAGLESILIAGALAIAQTLHSVANFEYPWFKLPIYRGDARLIVVFAHPARSSRSTLVYILMYFHAAHHLSHRVRVH